MYTIKNTRKQGKADRGDKASHDKHTVPNLQGPVARAFAKRFNEELNIFTKKLIKENMVQNEEIKMMNLVGPVHACLGREDVLIADLGRLGPN